MKKYVRSHDGRVNAGQGSQAISGPAISRGFCSHLLHDGHARVDGSGGGTQGACTAAGPMGIPAAQAPDLLPSPGPALETRSQSASCFYATPSNAGEAGRTQVTLYLSKLA